MVEEMIRSVYATAESAATDLLDDAMDWCTAVESGPELRRRAKMLRRWRSEIIAHHTTGASNGLVEAATCSSRP